MIALPGLLLSANAPGVIDVCTQIYEAQDPVVCDASAVMVAEPLALCALAVTLARMQRFQRTVRVEGLSLAFKRQLETLDILGASLHVARHEQLNRYQGDLHAYRVRTEADGNAAGNAIAEALAALVPLPPDFPGCHREVTRRNPIVLPLAYIFTELIDNAFRHARGRGYNHATVWMSGQYHPARGRIRLAVADDGCGFLQTFQGRTDLRVTNHAEAIRTGFRPYVSSKRDVGLFADAQHQGLGLTICRDVACRAQGNVAVVSGNAWVTNPETAEEVSRITRLWQGTIVSVELQLPALNAFNFYDITVRYNSNPDLPIRFM